jgi:hypothetical protein
VVVLPPVVPPVHVFRVARGTLPRQLHLIGWPPMTGFAGELAVRRRHIAGPEERFRIHGFNPPCSEEPTKKVRISAAPDVLSPHVSGQWMVGGNYVNGCDIPPSRAKRASSQ